jgi:hypothetical protein
MRCDYTKRIRVPSPRSVANQGSGQNQPCGLATNPTWYCQCERTSDDAEEIPIVASHSATLSGAVWILLRTHPGKRRIGA